MPSIPFIKGDKVDDSTDFRDALPVNYYAVLRDIYGEKGYMLLQQARVLVAALFWLLGQG